MDGNAINSCPTNLPTSLEMLSMAGCKLQSIDKLPYTLRKLRANYNFIKTVKLLPRHLLYLQISQNEIQSSILFKYRLPPMIRVLQLDYNELTWLPSTFPDSLETLNVSNNKITEFRAKLPASLKLLQLNDNTLTVFQPTFSVPQQPFVLYIQNNCITENLDYLREKRHVSTIFQGKNWNTALHTASARLIQFVFAKYKLKRGVRTWARINKIQEELFIVAMNPDRLGNFEPLPDWSI
jgi:Leucine-rich repeat (LRR) protein